MSKDESTEFSYHENKSPPSDIATPPSLPIPPFGLAERLLKPTVYIPRYPKWMIGKRLLWATCFFGSLGDALFGYDQGKAHIILLRGL
jgi:hypothetical protein